MGGEVAEDQYWSIGQIEKLEREMGIDNGRRRYWRGVVEKLEKKGSIISLMADVLFCYLNWLYLWHWLYLWPPSDSSN